jgi:hypothetical protein
MISFTHGAWLWFVTVKIFGEGHTRVEISGGRRNHTEEDSLE